MIPEAPNFSIVPRSVPMKMPHPALRARVSFLETIHSTNTATFFLCLQFYY